MSSTKSNPLRTLYFNCRSGISGDMIVGALLDLGINKRYLTTELKKLKLKNFKVKISKVTKKGIKATKFDVIAKEETKPQCLKNINSIIESSLLQKKVKELSKKIFLELAIAEAKTHNTSINQVHFHEVGALDSIIDIVSASILINKLDVQKILCSRISEGYGTIKIAHGRVNLPVPAVRELLKDAPIEVINIKKELITPTGAAILKTLKPNFSDEFSLSIQNKGYGAGTRDLEIPNVLEVCLMECPSHKKIVLETNIDDMNPEFYQYIIEKLIKEGAVDAYIQPCFMKKNRIGTFLHVICDEAKKDNLIKMIFQETTTFGIRITAFDRVELERKMQAVKTKYGIVNVKVGTYKGKVISAKPEYEDCKKLAIRNNIPLKLIYEEVREKFTF